MSYIKPHNAITDNELLRSPTENAVYDALALKQDAGNYITQLTGEVTALGPGAVSATITNQAVTNAKLAPMLTGTIKGNNSGSPASPSDLDGTTVTSMLDTFQVGLKGLVPAPTVGDASNYLKGDGTWATISIPASANPYLSNLLSPTAINQVLLGLDGSASAPAYSFTSDSNTGIYRSGSDTLNFTTGGTNKFQVESAGSVKLMSASGADILWNTDGGGNIGMAVGGGRPDGIYAKTTINLASLTASTFVGSDVSKNLVSLDASTATSYLNNFVGDGGSGGIKGLVPAPAAGDAAAGKYLKADGTWATAGISTAGALDQQVLAYDSGTGLTTWQYAGKGDGSFGNNVILGAGIGSLQTDRASVIISNSTNPYTTAYANVCIGSVPGPGNREYSTLVGINVQTYTGLAHTAFGWSAKCGEYGTSIGYGADAGGQFWSGCTAIGFGATCNSGNDAVAVGFQARATRDNTVAVGRNAKTDGANSTVVGAGSGNNATGANNTILGQGSATALTTGSGNTVVGQGNLLVGSNSGSNVIVGTDCASLQNLGLWNVILGYQAGKNFAGNVAVMIGNKAGYNTQEGGGVFIGEEAGYSNGSAVAAVAIGYNAARNTTANYDHSVSIGRAAGYATGTETVAIGYNAGNSGNSTNSVYLGAYAGQFGQNSSFFMDNQARGSLANQKTNSLMYGQFNATPSSQTLTINAQTTLANGVKFAAIHGQTGTVTVNPYNTYVGCDTSSGAVTLNLPAAATAKNGTFYYFKDESGNSATSSITITPNGIETIDGASSYVINVDYKSVALISDGSNWFLL